MTPAQIRERENFWHVTPGEKEHWEYEWIDDGVECSVDEQSTRSIDGWRYCGLTGMRHWVREKPLSFPFATPPRFSSADALKFWAVA